MTLYVEVNDEKELWRQARGHYKEENGICDDADLDQMFGPENEIDVGTCLRQLADPGESWSGTSILDSGAECLSAGEG